MFACLPGPVVLTSSSPLHVPVKSMSSRPRALVFRRLCWLALLVVIAYSPRVYLVVTKQAGLASYNHNTRTEKNFNYGPTHGHKQYTPISHTQTAHARHTGHEQTQSQGANSSCASTLDRAAAIRDALPKDGGAFDAASATPPLPSSWSARLPCAPAAILVAFCNKGMKDFGVNWALHVRKNNALASRHVLIALDDELADAMRERELEGSLLRASDFGTREEIVNKSLAGVTYFRQKLEPLRRMGAWRAMMLRALLLAGYDVLLSDVDIAWIGNPWPFVLTSPSRDNAEKERSARFVQLHDADMLVSVDLTNVRLANDPGLVDHEHNVGMVFFRATPRSVAFLSEWELRLGEQHVGGGTDQEEFNRIVKGMYRSSVGVPCSKQPNCVEPQVPRWPYVPTDCGDANGCSLRLVHGDPTSQPRVDIDAFVQGVAYPQSTKRAIETHMRHGIYPTFWMWHGRITVGVLPYLSFPGGHSIWVENTPNTTGVEPVAIHATFTFGDTPEYAFGKRERFREKALWDIEHSEYYGTRPRRFLQVHGLEAEIGRAVLALFAGGGKWADKGNLTGCSPGEVPSAFWAAARDAAIAEAPGGAIGPPYDATRTLEDAYGTVDALEVARLGMPRCMHPSHVVGARDREGATSRDPAEAHMAALEATRAVLRNALALAAAMDAAVVLPPMWCFCFRHWWVVSDCHIVGSDHIALPFRCPLDHAYEPSLFEKAGFEYRSHAFLSHPYVSKEIRDSVARLEVEDDDASDAQEGDDGPIAQSTPGHRHVIRFGTRFEDAAEALARETNERILRVPASHLLRLAPCWYRKSFRSPWSGRADEGRFLATIPNNDRARLGDAGASMKARLAKAFQVRLQFCSAERNRWMEEIASMAREKGDDAYLEIVRQFNCSGYPKERNIFNLGPHDLETCADNEKGQEVARRLHNGARHRSRSTLYGRPAEAWPVGFDTELGSTKSSVKKSVVGSEGVLSGLPRNSGYLMVTFATSSMEPFLRNWLASVRRAGIEDAVLVLALDDKTLSLCAGPLRCRARRASDLAAIHLRNQAQAGGEEDNSWSDFHSALEAHSLSHDGSYFSTGTPVFKRYSAVKTAALAALLTDGHAVIVSDSDTVWFSDPRPLFDSGNLQFADVLVSSDCIDIEEDRRYPTGCQNTNHNTGTLLLRPSAARFAAVWHHFVAHSQDAQMRDQPTFNLLVRQQKFSKNAALPGCVRSGEHTWFPPVIEEDLPFLLERRANDARSPDESAFIANSHHGDMRLARSRPLFHAANCSLTMSTLPIDVFLNGHTLFVQHLDDVRRSDPSLEPPVNVHCTYQYGDDPEFAFGKRQRLIESGLWEQFTDGVEKEDGVLNISDQRYITLTPPSPPPVLPTDIDSRVALRMHFAEDRRMRSALRDTLALAFSVNRTLGLPPLHCFVENIWKELHSGRVVPSMPLPYACPMDHLTDLPRFHRNIRRLNLRPGASGLGFAPSKEVEAATDRGIVHILVQRPLAKNGIGPCAPDVPKDGRVYDAKICGGLTSSGFRKLLSKFEHATVVQLTLEDVPAPWEERYEWPHESANAEQDGATTADPSLLVEAFETQLDPTHQGGGFFCGFDGGEDVDFDSIVEEMLRYRHPFIYDELWLERGKKPTMMEEPDALKRFDVAWFAFLFITSHSSIHKFTLTSINSTHNTTHTHTHTHIHTQ